MHYTHTLHSFHVAAGARQERIFFASGPTPSPPARPGPDKENGEDLDRGKRGLAGGLWLGARSQKAASTMEFRVEEGRITLAALAGSGR